MDLGRLIDIAKLFLHLKIEKKLYNINFSRVELAFIASTCQRSFRVRLD